jgi:membrane protein DedA with SNARE-associated domain
VFRLHAALPAGVNWLAWPRFGLANASGALLWATPFGTAGMSPTFILQTSGGLQGFMSYMAFAPSRRWGHSWGKPV